MKNIKNQNKRAFMAAFAFTLMGFMFIYGMGTAYVNSLNAYQKEPVSLLELHRISYDQAELSIAGESYIFPIKTEFTINDYMLMPPIVRMIYGGMYYMDGLF